MNFRAKYKRLKNPSYQWYKKAEITLPDGSSYINDFMEEAELKLCEYVQSIAHKLTDEELDKLSSLVEDYGRTKYNEGEADCERQQNYY